MSPYDDLEAMALARTYADLDPFYEGKEITHRERALMRLAIRAYTNPEATREAIAAMIASKTSS